MNKEGDGGGIKILKRIKYIYENVKVCKSCCKNVNMNKYLMKGRYVMIMW